MSEQDRQQQGTDRDREEPLDEGRPGAASRESAGKDGDSFDVGRLIDRRTLLKSGLLAGGALAGGGAALADLAAKQSVASSARSSGKRTIATGGGARAGEKSVAEISAKKRVPAGRRPPNILVIMVDQLRTPQWFSAGATAEAAMPNITGLANNGVSFANHYTASNDCTPARAALLTGLYTHQTGCMITGGSTLDPGFPTWGTMLREQDYKTYWYGKWHLTHGDNLWEAQEDAGALEPYGFAGGTYPSPDGAPGQGWRVDPHILSQFEQWFERGAPKHEPWCTTVSFVNPHDIAWWYRWSSRFAAEASAASVVGVLPANFETPEEMIARGKPALQRSLQDTAQVSFGAVPYSGPAVTQTWLPFLNLYMKLLSEVDAHVGGVLQTLASRPEVAANTVVVFTSDHGEYGASHGMRGKGASAYDEAIRVPLIVSDPRGVATQAAGRPRMGLTSSVDVAPLLLDIATGSSAWRKEKDYSHVASRHDVAAMLRDPSAPGRAQVLHATDETVTEFATEPYAAEAPLHVVALRTPTAKYATYSNFEAESIKAMTVGQETELYDYSTSQGRMELDNLAGNSALEEKLGAQLQKAVGEELREPLPTRLYAAHKRGLADYFNTAEKAALKATERRRERTEAESEPPTQPTPIEAPLGGEDEVGLNDSTKLRARRRADRRGSTRRIR